MRDVHIRWMIRRDMPEVLAIENRAFEYPWIDDDFIRALRQRNCIGMVAEHKEKVVGFMLYELNTHWLEMLKFAVHPDCQRQGVGAAMVQKLVGKLSPQRRTRLTIMVRESNLDGLYFFKAQGFDAVELVRQAYGCEDGIVMRYTLKERSASTTVQRVET